MDTSQVAILAFGIPILIAEAVMSFRIYRSDCRACRPVRRARQVCRTRRDGGRCPGLLIRIAGQACRIRRTCP